MNELFSSIIIDDGFFRFFSCHISLQPFKIGAFSIIQIHSLHSFTEDYRNVSVNSTKSFA